MVFMAGVIASAKAWRWEEVWLCHIPRMEGTVLYSKVYFPLFTKHIDSSFLFYDVSSNPLKE